MKMSNLLIVAVFSFSFTLFTSSCSKDNEDPQDQNSYRLFSKSGDLTNTIAEFRSLVGDQLNTTPGATSGRREINWDGIPDNLLNAKIPDDFFNPTGPGAPVQNQRGLVYTSAGQFQASKTGFFEVNEEAAGEFHSFSGNKVFANISSKVWDVEFRVAGQTQPAKVNGFGVVFSDVDIATSTSLEFFDGNTSLGKFFVIPHDAGSSFSFLGIHFNAPRISRIRVSHDGKLDDGNKDISAGGPSDLAVMDDFIYSEPVKVER
ncbi:hypothetical protein [Pollutibacter soli]|uniref:hypothetical protein n=1 Tax=Pollutibacter soli TaxID=3034157 RepID=UPI0030141B2F